MAKDGIIEVEGTVVEILPNTKFIVEIQTPACRRSIPPSNAYLPDLRFSHCSSSECLQGKSLPFSRKAFRLAARRRGGYQNMDSVNTYVQSKNGSDRRRLFALRGRGGRFLLECAPSLGRIGLLAGMLCGGVLP